MENKEIKELAEQNLAFVLRRAAESAGRLTEQDLASGSFFCRVVEAETIGSPYAGAGLLGTQHWDGALAKAAVSVPQGS